jgi:hypothetical protein
MEEKKIEEMEEKKIEEIIELKKRCLTYKCKYFRFVLIK